MTTWLPLMAHRLTGLTGLAVLGAGLTIGTTAAASPITADRLGASARGTAWQLVPGTNASAGSWTGPRIAGLSSAVNETLHAMAVNALSAEPAYRQFSPAPLSAAPDQVPEPATLGLLAAGCLAVMAFSKRIRPAGAAI